MAEGFLNHLGAGRFEARSAGTEPGALNPLAVQVMAEQGIYISGHSAKPPDAFLREPLDYVITACDDANGTCPIFTSVGHRVHWSFPDPSRAKGTPEERLAVFRAVRDAIRRRIEEFVTAAGVESQDTPRLTPGQQRR
jgi:arsenate reductase